MEVTPQPSLLPPEASQTTPMRSADCSSPASVVRKSVEVTPQPSLLPPEASQTTPMRSADCSSPASVVSQNSPSLIDSASLTVTALQKMICIIEASDRIVFSSENAVNMFSRSVKQLCIGLKGIESELLPMSEFNLLKLLKTHCSEQLTVVSNANGKKGYICLNKKLFDGLAQLHVSEDTLNDSVKKVRDESLAIDNKFFGTFNDKIISDQSPADGLIELVNRLLYGQPVSKGALAYISLSIASAIQYNMMDRVRNQVIVINDSKLVHSKWNSFKGINHKRLSQFMQ